jgi:hypothetical protein
MVARKPDSIAARGTAGGGRVQFVSMGLIGEMIVPTYHESQNNPIYVVKEEY